MLVAPPSATDDHSGRPARRRARNRAITELAIAGASIADIGERFDRKNIRAASRLVENAVDEHLPPADPEVAERLDLARLDALLEVWWPRSLEGDPIAGLLVVSIIEARQEVRATTGKTTSSGRGDDSLRASPPTLLASREIVSGATQLSEAATAALALLLHARTPTDLEGAATAIGDVADELTTPAKRLAAELLVAPLRDGQLQADPQSDQAVCLALVALGVVAPGSRV